MRVAFVRLRGMIRLTVLGSGSSGNATLLECGDTRLLIDAGFSAKRLTEKLQAIGIEPESLNGILVTHEHTDHVQAIPVFVKKWGTPVYVTRRTREEMRKCTDMVSWRFFESGDAFEIEGVQVGSFPISHDAIDPVGYHFSYGAFRYGHLSDVGRISPLIQSYLMDVHALFIESNYDPHLLEINESRPWMTKQRIASAHGHLSNMQAAEFVASILHKGLKHIILGHLSQECNTAEIALDCMRRALSAQSEHSPSLYCATAKGLDNWIRVSTPAVPSTPEGYALCQQEFNW